MTIGYIGFGANLSNPKRNFLDAVARLEAKSVAILDRSKLWSSPAWPPGSNQPDYINAVVKIGFEGEAEALLRILQKVETELGRVRSVKNAARTLDLDLLVFGDGAQNTDTLTLPHPRMMERAFVLLPLCEIAPNYLPDLARLPAADMDTMRYVGDW